MPTQRTREAGPQSRERRARVPARLAVLVAILLSGCSTPEPPPATVAPEAISISTAATLAPSPSATATTLPTAAPTATPSPTVPPTPSVEPSPTATASPIPSPAMPTPTSTAPPTSAPTLPAYDAAYVADVSIPDGMVIEPGTPFTKTWRLRNTGSAPWEDDITLELAVGEAMGAPEAVPVPATALGEAADVSVPMVAPAALGEHSAAWRLCRAEGCFGGAVTLQIVSRSALAARGPAVELPPAEPAACNYIGNRNPTSMKFHRADCRWVQEMYEGNKVCFATREEAVAAGYVPCKVCKP